jgi:hypothetical protein
MEHAREGYAVIHVLVLLECVLLLIIGFDKFIGVSTPDGPNDMVGQGVEASGEIQIGSMRSAIVPTAAAAGPDPVVSISPDGEADSILPLTPSD